MAAPQRNILITGLDEINMFRKQMNLPLIKQGMRSCLKCGRKFESDDIMRNRICYPCLQTIEMSSNKD